MTPIKQILYYDCGVFLVNTNNIFYHKYVTRLNFILLKLFLAKDGIYEPYHIVSKPTHRYVSHRPETRERIFRLLIPFERPNLLFLKPRRSSCNLLLLLLFLALWHVLSIFSITHKRALDDRTAIKRVIVGDKIIFKR